MPTPYAHIMHILQAAKTDLSLKTMSKMVNSTFAGFPEVLSVANVVRQLGLEREMSLDGSSYQCYCASNLGGE